MTTPIDRITVRQQKPIPQHQKPIIIISDDEEKPTTQTRKRKRKSTRDVHDNLPTNNWSMNPDQRPFLFLLRSCYKNTKPDITKLFNHAFAAHLASRKLPTGLTESTVYTQLQDPKSQAYEDVKKLLFETPFDQLLTRYVRIDGLIKSAAKALKLKLEARTRDDWRPKDLQSKKRKRRAASLSSESSGEMDNMDFDANDESPARSAKRHTTMLPSPPVTPRKQVLRAPLTPPSSISIRDRPKANPVSNIPNSDQAPKKPFDPLAGIPQHNGLPFLLFRAWSSTSHGSNSEDGFSAGLPLGIPPPASNDPAFLEHVGNHLHFRAVSSPLISLTPSVPTILKKAHSMTVPAEDVKITLVDTRMAAYDTKFYHAHPVISTLRQKVTGVRKRERGWDGIREACGVRNGQNGKELSKL